MKLPIFFAHGEGIIPFFSGVALVVFGFGLLVVAAIIEQSEKDPREVKARWKYAITGFLLMGLGIAQLIRFRFG